MKAGNNPKEIDVLANRIASNELWYNHCTTLYMREWAVHGTLARELRLKSGLSLRSLAKMMMISPAFLSDLELGRRNWNQKMVDRWQVVLANLGKP